MIDAVGLVGGFVESTDQSDGRSRLTVRVPSDQFDATLDRLLELGRERGLQVQGQDVTGAITDLDARLRNLRAQEAVLIDLMRKATTIGDSIAVQQQLSQNQEQIEQLDGQRRALADQTTFATLTVSITPNGAPVSRGESPATFGTAWDDAVDAAAAVTGGVLIVLGALLPIVVIGGAGRGGLAHRGAPPAAGAARWHPLPDEPDRVGTLRIVSFYDEVMRELIAAIGAALLVANLIALARRPKDATGPGGAVGRAQRQGEGELTGPGHRPHPSGRARPGAGRPVGGLRDPRLRHARRRHRRARRLTPRLRRRAGLGARGTRPAANPGAAPGSDCDVANVLMPNESFGLWNRPLGSWSARSHVTGDVYGVPLSAGTATSRQHDRVGSKPAAVIAIIATEVEFGSSAPNDCHAPFARCELARNASPWRRSGSVARDPAATSAWIASAVVSTSAARRRRSGHRRSSSRRRPPARRGCTRACRRARRRACAWRLPRTASR